MRRFFSILIALLTLGFIIIIHESGHFIACKLTGVPVLRFSLGFGPVLASTRIGETEFALSALPFGGYVSMDPYSFSQQPFGIKMFILLAGILCNIICASLIMILLVMITSAGRNPFFTTLKIGLQSTWDLMLASMRAVVGVATKKGQERLQGPLGTIMATSSLLQRNMIEYFFILASINMQVALFNILPIPFFDGGQVAQTIVETLMNGRISSTVMAIINVLFLVGLVLLVTHLTQRDIRRIREENS
jgi:regulator of sigma E protease